MCTSSPKKESGFDIAVLTQNSLDEALMTEASSFTKKEREERLFLLSKASTQSPTYDKEVKDASWSKKPKRTFNRKRVFWDDSFTHGDKRYKVNPAKSGLYTEILSAMIGQFEIAVAKWNRVFVLRFDLHTHSITKDNKIMTGFRKRLVQKLKRKYGFKEVGYCWVREQERAKSQHYHWVLFLDGDLLRHSKRINELIKQLWENPTGNNHMPVIKNPYHFVNNEESAQKAIYRISYLAKTRGKGYRAKQVKDYQCSRAKP